MSYPPSNNKRIAKNTMFLYVRQLITMVLSLFGTGIVMRELGVDDFGLYNVIGGIVVIFSVLQGAMSVGTQRFLNFEMGRGDEERVREVFNISKLLYYGIAILVVLLSETVGLWYLNHKMVIPEGRMFAAQCVFHASVVNCLLSVTQTPYVADIIANERMNVYGYLGVGESLLRFLLIFLLLVVNTDKLVFYALINLVVCIVFRIVYQLFCRRYFPESRFKFPADKKLVQEIVSFSGWSFLARVAYVGRDQGGALVVNSFFGVALNASMAVAGNVSNVISSFVQNFQTAFRPQLVKSYASGDIERLVSLFFFSSKISAFLILLIAVPAIVNIDFLLAMWLGTIPERSQLLIVILLSDSLVSALFAPFWMTIFAMGNIKKYQIVEGAVVLLNVPLMFLAFCSGLQIEWIYIIRLVLVVFLFLYAGVYIKRKMEFPVSKYLTEIVLPIVVVAGACIPSIIAIGGYFTGMGRVLVTVPVYCLYFVPLYLLIVFSKEEKKRFFNIVLRRFVR